MLTENSKLYRIHNMNTGAGWCFTAQTPYEAMTKLRYYLAIKDAKANDCVINKSESGKHLYLDYNDETWAVRNK